MPLPKPTLDNRHYDQLVSEGRALIPRLAPRWTNQNASDPGIALLELGAWLSEQNIYRFDHLSDAALRAFVRLLGVEPRPPSVAATVVELAGVAAPTLLPERLQLGGVAMPGVVADALFETASPLSLSPARLVWLASAHAADIGPITGTPGEAEGAITLLDADIALTRYQPFGAKARPGHAFYLGFDGPLEAGGLADARWSLHVWTAEWTSDQALRTALQERPDWRHHYRVTTTWEYFGDGQRWLPLANVDDQTRALSLSGFITFDAPPQHLQRAAGEPFLIRCRIVRGRFEVPPALLHIGWNAAGCEHAVSIAERVVARTRGHASAFFDLDCAPVVGGSVTIRLDDGAGGISSDWREAADFEQAGPFDQVFTLIPERGLLQSGDGRSGAILPAGCDLLASWRCGSGPEGNLSARTLQTAPATAHNLGLLPAGTLAVLTVTQPFKAAGGAARESLASAQSRAYALAGAVDKAVTLADIERLALTTPGAPVARVRAVAGLDPALPCYPAAGIVTIIAIPSSAGPAPMPSRALLNAISRYLHPRRLVTSELQIIAPRYRRVAVRATLVADGAISNAAAEALLRLARQRIDTLFHPLHGGPDGQGWPFGRTVYRAELMALLANLPGVAQVTDLSLLDGWPAAGVDAGKDSGCDCAACGSAGGGVGCANISLCEHELLMPGRHRLQVRSQRPSNLTRSDIHECQ